MAAEPVQLGIMGKLQMISIECHLTCVPLPSQLPTETMMPVSTVNSNHTAHQLYLYTCQHAGHFGSVLRWMSLYFKLSENMM